MNKVGCIIAIIANILFYSTIFYVLSKGYNTLNSEQKENSNLKPLNTILAVGLLYLPFGFWCLRTDGTSILMSLRSHVEDDLVDRIPYVKLTVGNSLYRCRGCILHYILLSILKGNIKFDKDKVTVNGEDAIKLAKPFIKRKCKDMVTHTYLIKFYSIINNGLDDSVRSIELNGRKLGELLPQVPVEDEEESYVTDVLPLSLFF